MKKFVCAILIACVICFSLCGCVTLATRSSVYSEGIQVKPGRFISDAPNCYVVTDTETGVQYLYCQSTYSGGVTVLVNSDGTPCIADDYEK